jgi:hypothetical protein
MNSATSNGYLMHNQSSSNQLSHVGQRKMKGGRKGKNMN